MTDKEYIKTLNVNGKEIKLGNDDYGQCYFIEYIDDNDEIQEVGLETYNFEYMETIYSFFDNNYKYLLRKYMFGDDMTEDELKSYNNYIEMFNKEYDK